MNIESIHRRLICLVLCLCLCLMWSMASAEPGPSIAISADGVSFPTEMVQRDYNALLQSYRILGGALTDEVRETALQETVDRYTARAMTEAWLIENGLHELDENTVYSLRSAAQQRYDSYWQSFRDMEALAALSDAEVTDYLEQNGMDIDYFYDACLNSYYTSLLMSRKGTLNPVTDEEVDQFFRENYLDPAHQRYDDNIPLFEQEVLYGEEQSPYAPDGFRAIAQIVLPVPEDIRAELVRLEGEADEQLAAAQAAYDRVAGLAMDGKDVTEDTAIYRAARQRIDELNVEYGRVWQSVLTAVQPECDELYARMEMGERFEDLALYYEPAPTLIYHQYTGQWPEELKAAADELTAVGDVSKPVLCADGVHLLYYQNDIAGGELEPDEDMREQIRALLEEDRVLKVLTELTTPWHDKYHLNVDLSGIRK